MDDSNVEVQGMPDCLRERNREARRLLCERACRRLPRLAERMLHGSFPKLGRRRTERLREESDAAL
jgi:hypothetical protein